MEKESTSIFAPEDSHIILRDAWLNTQVAGIGSLPWSYLLGGRLQTPFIESLMFP
jgi:hypothetical protein